MRKLVGLTVIVYLGQFSGGFTGLHFLNSNGRWYAPRRAIEADVRSELAIVSAGNMKPENRRGLQQRSGDFLRYSRFGNGRRCVKKALNFRPTSC